MSRSGTNKKTTTMTPIIELKRQSSRLKHYITLFLNILLVDCYVGKLLGHNHMVCIKKAPNVKSHGFYFPSSHEWDSFEQVLDSKTGAQPWGHHIFKAPQVSNLKNDLSKAFFKCFILQMNYDVAVWWQADTCQRSGIFLLVATFW